MVNPSIPLAAIRRIHRFGPSCRDDAGQQRCRARQSGGCKQRPASPRAHAKQQAAHESARRNGTQQSEEDPQRDQPAAIPENEASDRGRGHAKSNPDADLAVSLADRVGHNPVESDDAQYKRRQSLPPARSATSGGTRIPSPEFVWPWPFHRASPPGIHFADQCRYCRQ